MTSIDRTTAAYENDADATRRRLSNSLDELADNLTPGRMLDEVLSYAKGGGASFLKGLGNAASINPVPTLLIAAGAAMFLSGKGRIGPSAGSDRVPSWGRPSSGARTGQPGTAGPGVVGSAIKAAGDAASSVGSAIGSVASSVGSALGSVASGVGNAVGSGAATVGDAASAAADATLRGASSTISAVGDAAAAAAGMAGTAGHAAADAAGNAGESVGSFAESAGDAASDGMAYTREASERLANALTGRVATLVREQPLVFAAAGLAVGVAIAAALPRTKFEDDTMGETSDALKGAVAEAASAEFEVVKGAAGKVVDDISDAAASVGVTAGSAAQAVKGIGEKVKNVVEAGGEALTHATHVVAGTDGAEKPS